MKRTKHFYSLLNKNNQTVQIDLNNYRVICNTTGERKKFYHKYLAGLIERKYNNNIDLFRDSYTSRQPVDADQKRATQIQNRIDRLRAQLDQAIEQQTQLASQSQPAC
jgi:hypothetical protein